MSVTPGKLKAPTCTVNWMCVGSVQLCTRSINAVGMTLPITGLFLPNCVALQPTREVFP